MGKMQLVKKGLNYMSHYGVKGLARKVQEKLLSEPVPYNEWCRSHFVTEEEKARQRQVVFRNNPLISIVVPTYETPSKFLIELIECVIAQTYSKWELCLADGSNSDAVYEVAKKYMNYDARIKYKKLEVNSGISGNTNEAIKMTTGDFIGLLDHDDLLEADTLYEVVRVINDYPNTEMIYTDEDKVNEAATEYFKPHLKPDFNLDLLRSNNYICHLLVLKKSLTDRVGLYNNEFDGAQDYDYILRCTENTENIRHIPRALYHWRVSDNSTAENPMSKMYAYEAGKRAVSAHLNRLGIAAKVENAEDFGFYRVIYKRTKNPLVSIIVMADSKKAFVKWCISALKKSSYKNYEIIVAGNTNSLINKAVMKRANGKYALLVNEDVIVKDDKWLGEMLSQCMREEIGAVGGKLLASKSRLNGMKGNGQVVYHAGMIIGMDDFVGSAFAAMPARLTGYMHRATMLSNVSAVSPEFFMIEREFFKKLGGLNEDMDFVPAGIDLCFRIQDMGKKILYDPYVCANYMGKGYEVSEKDKALIKNIWKNNFQAGDRYYNKNFVLESPGYILKEEVEAE